LQTVKLYVNGNFIQEILLEVKDWQNYTVRLPAGYLTTGINTVRFVYKYTEAPARVEAKNADHRTLAVAFDYIVFRLNEGG
jgi:hypothetical protein